MTQEVRISGVQMLVSPDLERNLPKYLSHIAAAAEDGADLVLFPELSLTGYHGNFDDDDVRGALEQIATAAREHGIAVIVGTGWREDGATYIQTRAYQGDGTLLGTHEKMVPTGLEGVSGDRKWCTPGRTLRTFTWRGVTCGMLICNDLWVTPGGDPHPDPRLAYQLGKMGAQIVFHAINSGSDQRYLAWHESNLSVRALESKFHVATANAADMDRPINCSTGVMGRNGEWITRVDRLGEGRYLATLAV